LEGSIFNDALHNAHLVSVLFSFSIINSKLINRNDTIRKLAGKFYPDFMQTVNLSDFVTENLYLDEQLSRNEKKQLLDKYIEKLGSRQRCSTQTSCQTLRAT
jgi:hypothetical protein